LDGAFFPKTEEGTIVGNPMIAEAMALFLIKFLLFMRR
jgi:hypothetical protein